eukprot:294688-Pelagomonas_calceolata.AAC.2
MAGGDLEGYQTHPAPEPCYEEVTNLTDKLKTHMHNRHELGSADTSGYYYNSWQRLNYATQPNFPNTTVNLEAQLTLPTHQQRNQQLLLG